MELIKGAVMFDTWWDVNQAKIYRALAESLPGNDYRYTMEKKFHDAYNHGWKSAFKDLVPRVTKTKTLDGGVVYDHRGMVTADREFNIRAVINEAQTAALVDYFGIGKPKISEVEE